MKVLKVAIFESQIHELQKIDSLLQNSTLFFDTVLSNNTEHGLETINEHDFFHLIIVNQIMNDYNKINQDFLKKLFTKYNQSKFIFLQKAEKHSSTIIAIMEEQFDYDPWIAVPISPMGLLGKIGEIFPDISERPKGSNEYAKISLTDLKRCSVVPCDVSIRLSSGKMIKIQNEGDKLNIEFFEKYVIKGIKHFHVLRACYMKKFDHFYPKQLVNKKLFKTEDQYVVKAHESLHNLISDFGISTDTLETVAELADETMSVLKDNKLGSILALLQNDENSFIYDHSYLVSLICMDAARQFEWYNTKHDKIITMGALLHDTGFKSPKLAAIELLSDERKKQIDPKIIKMYKDHPRLIADQLKEIHQVPSDVLGIVYKHHEGFGPEKSFPRGFRSTQLSALECLFVMSHEVVIIFYKNKFNKELIHSALDSFWEELNTGYFRKYLDGFRKSVLDIMKTM